MGRESEIVRILSGWRDWNRQHTSSKICRFDLLLLAGFDQVAGALATILFIQPVFSALFLMIRAGRLFLSFRFVATPDGGVKGNAFQFIFAKMLINHYTDRAGQQAKDQGDM